MVFEAKLREDNLDGLDSPLRVGIWKRSTTCNSKSAWRASLSVALNDADQSMGQVTDKADRIFDK